MLTYFNHTAQNTFSTLKSKLKGIFGGKKKSTEAPAEPTKTEDPAANPTEAAATEAAADPVAAAARELPNLILHFRVLFAKNQLERDANGVESVLIR